MLIKRGFTVIELLIVIVVIGILATVTFNSFAGMQAKAITAKRRGFNYLFQGYFNCPRKYR